MQPAAEPAAEWYRERHCWPVLVVEGAVVLPLGRGVVALDVPAERAATVYKNLKHNDIRTPAVLTTEPEPRVVFLAEADDSVLGQFQMPWDVRYLTVPQALPLPLLAESKASDRKWFCAPDPGRRWLPRASAVLAAVNDATPVSLRAYWQSWRSTDERLLIG